MSMKRILLTACCSFLFLCGCKNNETLNPLSAKTYWTSYELREQFEKVGFQCGSINLFIGENNDQIGMIFEGGSLTEEDLISHDYQFKSDEHGNVYVYYGKLNKISENIYSCNGSYLTYYKRAEDLITEDIDFYIIEKEDKLYFIFEDLSLEELENYSSELFATFHDYRTNEIFTRTIEKRQYEED